MTSRRTAKRAHPVPTPSLSDRERVWIALSELFLDTELDAADHRRIARSLRASGYRVETLETILRDEVYPVCIGSLCSVAGPWQGFDTAELIAAIAARRSTRGKPRARWRWYWWMIAPDWQAIRARLLTDP